MEVSWGEVILFFSSCSWSKVLGVANPFVALVTAEGTGEVRIHSPFSAIAIVLLTQSSSVEVVGDKLTSGTCPRTSACSPPPPT